MKLKTRLAFSSILVFLSLMATGGGAFAAKDVTVDYERARWDPIHFKPAIDNASNEQCLSCHQEVLDRKVRQQSPAGVQATEAMAWYQTLSTYEGEQDTFHRRHLATPMAKQLMDLKCNTCHQGNDPREEAMLPPDHANQNFTLRKAVNPNICLMCHGANNYTVMGLPGPWSESSSMFQGNCLLCHAGIRTNRHQVNFLKADAIEAAGKENSDVCYGCHGGRQWYRIAFPYPRNAWDGMAKDVPDWAKDRPTESAERFQIKSQQAAK
ncbi:MAG: hypothetical protein AB2814_06835 [Candidatus Sedimenticola endophacoides]|uniref:Uncharacterized protein n=1 Tax=Candidatus Sedimenticola endophacoides TaxID=2548426 RepID=A0A6N4DUG4_9GAMM|nr:MAG: hypothetical protein B0D96_00135 [Candidatus Sedimenticola endophacoides]OQX48393.1 MAG: hypothetical protein B0D87_05925 [Candidatus Sedimenticola endophacoides]PUE00987.1 MAG: hypothetical protein C3L24_08570 [Candidatus Sedimenticola endophacoides]